MKYFYFLLKGIVQQKIFTLMLLQFALMNTKEDILLNVCNQTVHEPHSHPQYSFLLHE